MDHDGDILGSRDAIADGKKVTPDHFDSRTVVTERNQCVDLRQIARGPDETAEIAEPQIQEALKDVGANKSIRTCDQYQVAAIDNEPLRRCRFVWGRKLDCWASSSFIRGLRRRAEW